MGQYAREPGQTARTTGINSTAVPSTGELDMPKFAANLSMLFTELPFPDRFAAAAKAGFRGVEYLFPYAMTKDDIAERLHAHGLTQVLFNLPGGNWDAGERGIGCHPDRVSEFQEGVGKAIEYAK